MKKQYFIIGMLVLLLTSCGFHLRGMADKPSGLNNVAIVVQNAHHDLGPLLKDQLQTYAIQINDPTQANYLLIIEQDGRRQQITNVAASTAPRQYILTYDVQFTLVKTKGEVIIPSRHVIVTRQLTVNNDRILGSNSEEATLYNEMRRDAAIQIINRLSR